MARSSILSPSLAINSDDGSVSYSMIEGEQIEYPINLNFLTDVTADYIFEAVIIEADNLPSNNLLPKSIRPGGAQTTLNIRLPNKRGEWNQDLVYYKGDFVTYLGKIYESFSRDSHISSITPDLDQIWEEVTFSRLYLQIPSTLIDGWAVKPSIDNSVYGFIELSITEPARFGSFVSTWKPLRGVVQILFSPTALVE